MRLRSSNKGSTLISLALVLPILMLSTFGVLELYFYYEATSAVQLAGTLAIDVARAGDIRKASDYSSYLNWTGSSNQIYPGLVISEQCQGWNSNTSNGCLGGFSNTTASLNPGKFKVWKGYGGNFPIPAASTEELPFKLYDFDETKGFSRVQNLPVVGIEYGCYETFNETGTAIDPSDTTSTGNCSDVRPMYWESPEKADFDGDGKEDIVFFAPNGTDSAYGGNPADSATYKSNVDFVVYFSGANYSGGLTGHGFMNMGIDNCGGVAGCTTPQPLPIVADYDGDGISDYGTFDPVVGKYYISFSTNGYREIKEKDISGKVSDATGALGIIAIPGTYPADAADPANKGVAFVYTGSVSGGLLNTANSRFDTYFVTGIDYSTAATGVALPDVDAVDQSVKPIRGLVSVPAFANYDQDPSGITKIGYLSFSGGNKAKWIGGDIKKENTDLSHEALFTDVSATFSDPKQARMNPFAMAFDSNDNLYVSDAVGNRVLRIDKGGDGEPTGDTQVIVNQVSDDPQADPSSGASLATFYPMESVWNVPPINSKGLPIDISDSSTYPADTGTSAKEIFLQHPKGIAVGPDNALYIADFGMEIDDSGTAVPGYGRIVRIYNGGSAVNSSSDAIEVIGSLGCYGAYASGAPCSYIHTANAAPGSGSPYTGLDFPNLAVNPIALAIVPDPTDGSGNRYHLAFSDGNAVYIIKTDPAYASGANGYGPSGWKNERLIRVAGVGDDIDPVFRVPPQLNYTPGNLGDATNSSMCPITALKFDFVKYNRGGGKASLVAGVTCNIVPRPIRPTSAFAPYSGDPGKWVCNPAFYGASLSHIECASVGGILRISATDGTGALDTDFGLGTNKFLKMAGHFQMFPSRPDTDSVQPFGIGSFGAAQRKIDISGNRFGTDVDIVGVPSLEILPDGNILFINQHNREQAINIAGLGVTVDRMFGNGVYLLVIHDEDTAAGTILDNVEAVTNPFALGSDTIPVESAYWWRPSTDAAGAKTIYTDPWEAPVKNVPFAAVAGLALSNDKKRLYASTPFLANTPSGISTGGLDLVGNEGTVYQTDARKVGFIERISLDHDGDNMSDYQTGAGDWLDPGAINDGNIDGDEVANGSEGTALTFRSQFCPEFGTTALTFCRTEERIGNPNQYFFRRDGLEFKAYPDPGAYTDVAANLVQYYMFNSVGEFVAESPGEASGSRPEVWATLLNDSEAPPIAMAASLHSFVNNEDLLFSPDGAGGANFLSPVITTLLPKENQIKPVARRKLAANKPANIYSYFQQEGAICGSYFPVTLGIASGTTGMVPLAIFFGLDLTNYLLSYQYSGEAAGSDPNSNRDNDNLNYLGNCQDLTSGGALPVLPDGRKVATEGTVLQLDNDDAGRSAGSNWPAPLMNGRTATDGERTRLFVMIDHDGDGARDPTFLSRDSFVDVDTGATYATKIEPYILATGNLNANKVKSVQASLYPFSYTQSTGTNKFPFAEAYSQALVKYPRAFLNMRDALGSNSIVSYLFDSGRANNGGFILPLDLETFIPNQLRSAGATVDPGGFVESTSSTNNKFSYSGSDGLVLQAAKKILKKDLRLEDAEFETNAAATLNPGMARVVLLPVGCEQGGTPALNCDSLRVEYNFDLFGTPFMIKKEFPFKYSPNYSTTANDVS